MKSLFTIILCATASLLWSQDKITGYVIDETDTPIYGADVYWANSSIGTNTDEKGFFTLPYSEKHNSLIASFVGYKDKTITIDKSKNIKIKLEEDNQLGEVIIKTKKRNTEHSIKTTANTVTMNSGELLKAACCNISEVFETNPSVDVNFSDAVTGAKEIKMLGLTGPYISITEGNIPSVRGASQAYGLTFTPGTWIESIQVTKGTGSVMNGFESISGQINTEFIKPAEDIPLFLNVYGSTDSRFEANLHANAKLSDKLSTTLFTHSSSNIAKNDMNKDGFLDNPLGQQINLMNRWQYENLEDGIIGFLTLRYMNDGKQGGQVNYDKKKDKPIGNIGTVWGSEINTEKFDASSKIGYIFPENPEQSIGLQLSYNHHKQDSYFGLKQYYIKQNSIYSKLIFNSIIGSDMNKYSTGINLTMDKFDERLNFTTNKEYNRIDKSVGAFFEYTYDNEDNLSIITGVRFDLHNNLGAFFTPRFNLRYNPWEESVIRLSAGRGKKAANIFAENQNLFASSREFIISDSNGKLYGLNPETAWNYGLSFSQGFHIFERKAHIGADFFRTDFQNQVVVDLDHNTHQVNFYNLEGKSYANSLQVDFDYSLIYNLKLKAAYKYYDNKTDYKDGLQEKPLQAKHRLFANLEYETIPNDNNGYWKFDFTYNWVGQQRLPNTLQNEPQNRLDDYSKAFSTMNAQITKVFNKNFELYIGGENIGNYKQNRAILGANDPFGSNFDGSLVYAPIYGNMYYAGLRLKLN